MKRRLLGILCCAFGAVAVMSGGVRAAGHDDGPKQLSRSESKVCSLISEVSAESAYVSGRSLELAALKAVGEVVKGKGGNAYLVKSYVVTPDRIDAPSRGIVTVDAFKCPSAPEQN